MRQFKVPFTHTCSESVKDGVKVVRFVSAKSRFAWWDQVVWWEALEEGGFRRPVTATGLWPYEYHCPYCGVRLDTDLMQRTVAERMRDVKPSDLSRGSFADIMRRCMYGDGDQSDALECYDLMADLCTLLDPDGDPETEACDD